jgi:hypothetical protein
MDGELQSIVTRFLSQALTGESVLGIEELVRAALFRTGVSVIGDLFQTVADRIDAAYCPQAGESFKARVPTEVHCLFGHFPLRRDYYYHPRRGGHYPVDEALGLDDGHTPGLVRLACLEGADESGYEKAQAHLLATGGIHMDGRQIHRLVQRVGPVAQAWQQRPYENGQEERTSVPILYVSADGTGIPMRPEELKGRSGKQADGTAKTRQVYLGCVFTQHGRDERGRPIRDWESTTYVSSMDSSDVFGVLLRHEALRRGMSSARRVVLIIDGAGGLETMGLINFKDAIQIVDFYHALDHAGNVLAAVLGNKDHPDYDARRRRWAKRLLRNGVAALVAETREECAGTTRADAVEKELLYFANNIPRMQYGTFRRLGFFIGSGVIEAGCKTVVGARCKQSGMFWGIPGAEHVLSLRCIHASRRSNAFWNHRLDQLASRYYARRPAA